MIINQKEKYIKEKEKKTKSVLKRQVFLQI